MTPKLFPVIRPKIGSTVYVHPKDEAAPAWEAILLGYTEGGDYRVRSATPGATMAQIVTRISVAPETSVPIDRPHRFEIGDYVRHADETPGSSGTRVVALTLRIVGGIAYPTYTLRDRVLGEDVPDVLDTDDLQAGVS